MKKFSLLILLSIAMPIATIAMYNDNNEKNDPNTPSKNRVIQPKNTENQEVGQEEEASLESEFGNPKTPAKPTVEENILAGQTVFSHALQNPTTGSIRMVGTSETVYEDMDDNETGKIKYRTRNNGAFKINDFETANRLLLQNMIQNHEHSSDKIASEIKIRNNISKYKKSPIHAKLENLFSKQYRKISPRSQRLMAKDLSITLLYDEIFDNKSPETKRLLSNYARKIAKKIISDREKKKNQSNQPYNCGDARKKYDYNEDDNFDGEGNGDCSKCLFA